MAALDVSMSPEAQVNALIKLEALRKHTENSPQELPLNKLLIGNVHGKTSGYSKDPKSGTVFYAPDGPDGEKFYLDNGKFVPIGG